MVAYLLRLIRLGLLAAGGDSLGEAGVDERRPASGDGEEENGGSLGGGRGGRLSMFGFIGGGRFLGGDGVGCGFGRGSVLDLAGGGGGKGGGRSAASDNSLGMLIDFFLAGRGGMSGGRS